MSLIEKANIDLVMDYGTDLVDFYIKHPCTAAYELLGVDLAPIQRIIFKDMWFKNYSITVCSRGGGKTYLLAVLSLLSCMLYPGYRVGLIAPVFRQCLPLIPGYYDTFWTSEGLYSTAESFYDSIENRGTSIQSLKSPNIILNKWKNKERDCVIINTKKGYCTAGTVGHKILVLDDKLNLIDKEIQKLTTKDYLVLKKGFNYFGNNNILPSFNEFISDWRTKDCKIPETLTPDLSYWMGLLLGDGCVSISTVGRKYRIDFVNEDQELLDYFENYLKDYFIYDEENIDRRNRKNNTWEIQYFSKKLTYYLLKCGFTDTIAGDKKIPYVVKRSSMDCMVSFIQGLMDTDGTVSGEVSLSTSSIRLAKEVQSVFLNLGILSSLNKDGSGYKVRVIDRNSIIKFRNIIGFRLTHKKFKLNNMITKEISRISNSDTMPISDIHYNLIKQCKSSLRRGDSAIRFLGNIKNNIDHNHTISIERVKKLLDVADLNNIITDDYNKLKILVDLDISFVKIKSIEHIRAHSIDIEVENEHRYWANGFINHNSKMIFAEVEKLYSRSILLREACEKKPTRNPDTCYLKFKSIGGFSGSYIEALPLADGSKIRGSRFYLVVMDELAQITDKIIDMVIRPMAATTLEPMENVRRIEREKRLIEQGLATEDDFEEETVNKMIMTSSGFYKFNHMWRRMRDYWEQMEKFGDENSQYVVHQIPYWDLPEGFLDKNNIDEAKRVMSNAEFRMEYEAAMISDSEGFFKASLLESCTLDSGFSIEAKGKAGEQYIVGVDPNQGGSSSCGICIVKLGHINKLVNVLEIKKNTTQELTKTIQNICDAYNVMRIFMDKGGGGKSVCDLLEDGYDGYDPIIDITNKDHEHMKGRHILEMVNFNPGWISDANFTTLSLLENKTLRFPEPPTSSLDLDARVYESIKKLKSQMLNIIVTQTSSGLLHFDTPKRGQNKDLYSAFILAGHGIREFEKCMEPEAPPELLNSGLVRRHQPGARFASLGGKAVIDSNRGSSNPLSAALLTPRKK